MDGIITKALARFGQCAKADLELASYAQDGARVVKLPTAQAMIAADMDACQKELARWTRDALDHYEAAAVKALAQAERRTPEGLTFSPTLAADLAHALARLRAELVEKSLPS